MIISRNWLTDYVEINLPAQELGDLFTRIGLNCEGIETTPDGDVVYDLEVTSNRPDWLGHLGVARELAAATDKPFRRPAITLPHAVDKVTELTSVDVQAPALCPRYTARVIRNVTVGPSPDWLKTRLEAVGLRSVNNIVDITNYVLMEYAQPLHAFDYDKLAENRIVVRLAQKGETIRSIDETPCELRDTMLVIADAEKPIALAGIMGGQSSEVSATTVNVLLESATFDPLATRHTSRALGIASDASFRFERGVDPVALEEASRRACQLICELAGGELVEGFIDACQTPWQEQTVSLRPARTCALLGVEISTEQQIDILDKLGLAPTLEGDAGQETILCTPPPFRADLTREADLIEEVARLFGYDNIVPHTRVEHEVIPLGRTERIRRTTLETLNAAGASEAIAFSFCDAEEAKLFGAAAPTCVDANVRKTNNALRPTLLPSLLRAVKSNQDVGNTDVCLFELAAVFPPKGQADATPRENALPDEHTELAIVSTRGLRDVRGIAQAVIERLVPKAAVTIQPSDAPLETLLLNGEPIGTIGLIAPPKMADVQKYFGLTSLPSPLGAATIHYDKLAKQTNLLRTATALPKFPPIRRDLSLIVDEPITWGQFIQVIDAVEQPLRAGLEYVTTYRGKPVPKGKKSVTMTFEYRWDGGTLTNEQVDQQIEQLLQAAKETLDATLRT